MSLTDLLTFTRAAGSECSREKRFTCSRRAMEEHTSWRSDAKSLKDLRIQQGQSDHLLQLLYVRLKAADLVEGQLR